MIRKAEFLYRHDKTIEQEVASVLEQLYSRLEEDGYYSGEFSIEGAKGIIGEIVLRVEKELKGKGWSVSSHAKPSIHAFEIEVD